MPRIGIGLGAGFLGGRLGITLGAGGVPLFAITFNGQPLTFGGQPVTFGAP